MKVIVFGASGKVGRLIVDKLLNDGHDVTVFIHKSSPFAETKNLHLTKGDIHTLLDVEKALGSNEVVISALGSWGTKKKDIVESGMANIIYAMSSSKTKRIVSLTGSEAVAEGDNTSTLSRLTHYLISVSPAKRILKDGESHIRALQSSKLDWTIVRSPIMNTRGKPTDFSLSNTRPRFWATVNRQSVANAMVEIINSIEYYKKSPYIGGGKEGR